MEKVATMMPQLEKMLPKLDSILGSLNTVLADPAIPATLHNVQNLTANLAVTSGQLQTLMNKDIPQLTGKLNTIGDNFVLISNNLKEIDYATAMQSIDSTLANVKMLTDKLNRKDNTVGLLLNHPVALQQSECHHGKRSELVGRLEIASETLRPFLFVRQER